MIININKIGNAGLVFDYKAFDLPPNVAQAGANVIMNEGRIEKAKGYKDLYTTSIEYDYMCGWFNELTNAHIIISQTEIYRKNDIASEVIITPTEGFLPSDYWQHANVGNVILLNNALSAPFVARPTDALLLPLGNWNPQTTGEPPVDRYVWTAEQVVSFAGFLVAVGVVKDGKSLPLLVKWSDVLSADIIEEPPSWDEEDPTTLAGENPINSAGEIVTTKELNGALIVYTQGSVHSMTYVGGQFVFNFRPLFEDDGIYNKNCVAEFFNKHLVVGFNSIYVTDGNTKTQVAEGAVQDAFYADLGDRNSVFVTNDIINRRILIHYKSKNRNQAVPDVPSVRTSRGGAEFDSFLAYSYKDNTWTFQTLRFLQDPVLYPAGALLPNQCEVLPELPFAAGSWDSVLYPTWNDWDDESWSDLFFLDGINFIGYAANPKVIQANIGTTYNRVDGAVITDLDYYSYFENSKIDLNEYFQSHVPILYISRIFPQATGTGTLKFQVAASKTAKDSIGWNDHPVLEFNLGDSENSEGDYKIDLRRTGRYLAIRVLSDDNTNWSLSGYDIEVTPNGAR